MNKHVVKCIGYLAAAARDDISWRPLNYEILMKTRHNSPEVRFFVNIFNVTCEYSVFNSRKYKSFNLLEIFLHSDTKQVFVFRTIAVNHFGNSVKSCIFIFSKSLKQASKALILVTDILR